MFLIAVALLLGLIAISVLFAFLLHPLLPPTLRRPFGASNHRLGVALGAQSVQAAARKILGPLAFAIQEDASNRLNGITNIEVSFYQAALPRWLPSPWRSRIVESGRSSFRTLSFVRKVFAGPYEAAMLRALYRYQAVHPPSSIPPVPRVLGVHPEPVSCTAYLEDLPSTGEWRLASKEDAVLLARSIADLQAYLAWAEAYCELSLPGQSLLLNSRRAKELILGADEPGFDSETFLERLGRVRARLAALPLLLSHNDIGPHNMSVSRAPDSRLVIRFIDFGIAHRNFLGADLHHYAVWSLANASNQRIFNALVAAYAEAVCQPLRDVRLGAYGYALRRILMRWWRVEELRGSQQRSRAYLCKIGALLEKAEQEIG